MRIRKHISKLLLIGILTNNLSILSNAGTLSSDTRYETFEGNNITIPDVLEEDKAHVEIEGNTLVNLVKKDAYNSGGLQLSAPFYNFETTYPLDKNKVYSLVVKGLEGVVEKICLTNASGSISMGYTNYNNVIHFTPFYENNKRLYIKLLDGKTVDDIKNCNIMIFEGRLIESQIPVKYIEGVKSVGELENNTIEIKSQNVNLFNESEIKFDKSFVFTDGKYVIPQNTPTQWGASDFIDVKPNTTYTVSVSQELLDAGCRWAVGTQYNGIYGYDAYRPDVIADVRDSNSVTFTTDNNTTKILIGICTDSNYEISRPEVRLNIKLEYGDVATKYVPYQENKNKIILNEPLRGIEGGAKDRIIKKNGQWFIERNCGELTFNGSEGWHIGYGGETGDQNKFEYSIRGNTTLSGSNYKSLCDKFNFQNTSAVPNVGNYRISYDGVANKGIFILFNPSTDIIPLHDINAWKRWLSNNPVTVLYQLATPIYEPLSIDSTINLFKEITYISNNSAVPANMKVIVDRVVNRAKEFSEIARLNPTVQNLSQARYWVNLMRESSFKDGLQENLDNIIDISDMTIEKKSVSANADIYIKSKNTLSLSLDTNNIMFENFNGTESIEKTNAVNLTVSSSLPYKINAYLEDEIQNSDKSSVIDKSVLNIKANSDTAYKSFVDTTSPIVLLDNQVEGRYNSHGVDIRLNGGLTHKADVYKTIIKFEVEQK